jgi:hypothetical protein
VPDTSAFHFKLRRIRDQIKGLALRDRQRKIVGLKEVEDIDQLFQFAYRPSSFELKFGKVTKKNLGYYQDLIKVLAHKTDFRFAAIWIDRKDSNYKFESYLSMYQTIIARYFDGADCNDTIFVPDEFDAGLSWENVVDSNRIVATIPIESHSCLAMQCCDVLGGIIGLGLKETESYTNSDLVRLPLLQTFEEEFKCKIEKDIVVSYPKSIRIQSALIDNE